MLKPRTLFIAGAVLFLVAWVLPVAKDGVTLPDGLPGWQAFRVAASPVWPYKGVHSDTWYAAALSVLSAATNFVMLAVLAFSVRRANTRALAMAALVAFVVNAHWMLQSGLLIDLRIGYFAWWLSFFIVGYGLLRAQRVATPPPAAIAA